MIWVLFGCILLIYPMVRIVHNRKRPSATCNVCPVPRGNISVFMDKKGNIDIIPFSLDKLKRGKASDYPISLQRPFSAAGLGSAVRDGLTRSVGKKYLSSEELMRSLGFYHWRDYSNGRKSVSVICREKNVVIHPTIRRIDGSYVFRTKGFEKVLSEELSDEVLGKAILEKMKNSR